MKNSVSRILSGIRFFIYTNIFIALCVTAYTIKTSILLFGNYGNLHACILVFCATLLFYCFHRINKKRFIAEDENEIGANIWMNTNKKIYYIIIALSFIVGTLQLIYLPIRTWLILIPVGLLGLGYTFPVIPTKKGLKRLRDIYWLKPFWIALAFSILTTFLPVLCIEPLDSLYKPSVLFILARSMLFLFALCIPFDIRDMHFDQLKKVNTLPVLTGAKTSVQISIILILFFISLVCIQFLYFNFDFKSALALFTSALLTIGFLLLAIPKRPALFYPLVFDGSMLLQCLLIIAFTHL